MFPNQAGGAGGGVNPAYTAAKTKQKHRHGQAYEFLYKSQTDPNIRQMLADLADTNPAELAGDAWALVLRECDVPTPQDNAQAERANGIVELDQSGNCDLSFDSCVLVR